MTKQQLQLMEQQIKESWEQEASKYTDKVSKLDNVQKSVFTCSRNLYDTLKTNLTNHGKIDIANVRSTDFYDGNVFPHSLKTNELAMAWIMKVGDNPDMLKRLFPNQAMKGLNRLRNVTIEKKLYDFNRPGLNEIIKNGKSVDVPIDFKIVLVILRYALLCEIQKYDELISVETKRPGAIKNGYIKIETKY